MQLRVGRFSALSTAPLDFYAPRGMYGFAHRPTGAPAVSHMSDFFWLDAAKSVIAANYPLIILVPL